MRLPKIWKHLFYTIIYARLARGSPRGNPPKTHEVAAKQSCTTVKISRKAEAKKNEILPSELGVPGKPRLANVMNTETNCED